MQQRYDICGKAEDVYSTIIDTVGSGQAYKARHGVPGPEESRRQIRDLMRGVGAGVG